MPFFRNELLKSVVHVKRSVTWQQQRRAMTKRRYSNPWNDKLQVQWQWSATIKEFKVVWKKEEKKICLDSHNAKVNVNAKRWDIFTFVLVSLMQSSFVCEKIVMHFVFVFNFNGHFNREWRHGTGICDRGVIHWVRDLWGSARCHTQTCQELNSIAIDRIHSVEKKKTFYDFVDGIIYSVRIASSAHQSWIK